MSSIQRKSGKLRVFISYSRQNIAFVDSLQASLVDRDIEAAVDRTEIEKSEDWWKRIQQLITEADTVVFVLSRSSVSSGVCQDEVDFAEELKKRFVPLVVEDIAGLKVPDALARLNYIFFIPDAASGANGDFSEAIDQLERALEIDIGWIREHTRLGAVAQRWVAQGQRSDLLLRGVELTAAEHWITTRPLKAPDPSDAHRAFLASSRKAATRRQRRWVAALSATAAAFAVIAGVALVQLYQVETARRLTAAQALAQRRPTEALLALAETKDRWLADKSLLARFTPALIRARLTLARQMVGESTSGVAWLRGGGYVAASTDGHARLWSEQHRLVVRVPARRVSTASERQGFGKGVVPLSSAWPAGGGNALATRDWMGCVRLLPTGALAGTDAEVKDSQHCINRNADGSETEYLPAAIHSDGTIAIARAGVIEIRGTWSGDTAVPANRVGQVDWVDFSPTGSIAIGFKDKAIGRLTRDRRRIEMIEPQERSGFCPDGSLWATSADGLLTRYDDAGRSSKKLAGKSPWMLSTGCTLYLDADGDLYRLDADMVPHKRGIADAWQYGANARTVATSKSDRYLAISSNDGRIAVHDLVDNVVLDLLGHTQRVFAMVFDEQETRLLSSSLDGTVRVFGLNESLIADGGVFNSAEAVYSAAAGGVVVSSKSFDYVDLSQYPVLTKIEMPGLPSGAPVVIRHDWRIGENHVLADGDTQFVAICRTARCPDGSVVRELKSDFIGSGGNTNAKVSGEDEFLAAYDDGRAINIFDLRGSDELPTLSFPDDSVSSLAFDAKMLTLFLLRGKQLGIMPFGARELSDRLAKTVKFCLSAGERHLIFGEVKWLADPKEPFRGLRR
jgi:WD40 repeat protein